MNENEWACEMKRDCGTVKGLGWRIAFSAFTGLLWFTFLITWLFFLAGDYGVLQNVGIFLGSVVVLGLANMAVWLTFAMSMEKMSEVTCKGHRHEVIGAGMGLIWVVGAALWLFLYAGDYSIYQNLGVLILSVVPIAAVGMLMKL
jgi:hypothetical protein